MENTLPPHFTSQSQPAQKEMPIQEKAPSPSGAHKSTIKSEETMDFTQGSSQNHGTFASHTSAFSTIDMSNNLPSYAQQNHYLPPYTSHISHASSMHENLAYAQIQNPHWGPQVVSQYTQQYPHNMHVSYVGYDAIRANHLTDLLPQRQTHPYQQVPYNMNMAPHPQYPNFQAYSGGSYASVHNMQYGGRQNMSYQMPRPFPDPQGSRPDLRRDVSDVSPQVVSTLRGPPRKPKQSGHALWVGNLPPGTQITDLKDHLSRDATGDIQSVFLISKSNCAFVNYKTAQSCAAAMTRFHESRFKGMRLVCRLRRGSSPNTTSSDFAQSRPKDALLTQPKFSASENLSTDSALASASSFIAPPRVIEKLVKEKFFIVKSLTQEDVDRAISSSTWATQSQNEKNFNLAYETAENVYFIFSVNKSGEYCGYARMDSLIGADTTQVLEPPADLPNTGTTIEDGPITIPTAATATAPPGYIVDDSARGSIFWEADSQPSSPTAKSEEEDHEFDDVTNDDNAIEDPVNLSSGVGKPFKITWQSTEKLPFIRTRGLRNSWNSNREVKIARDGTEVEPTIGRRLVSMFEQQSQINAADLRNQNTITGLSAPQYQPMLYPNTGQPGSYNYSGPTSNTPYRNNY